MNIQCTNCNSRTRDILTEEDEVVCDECGCVKDKLYRLTQDLPWGENPTFEHNYILCYGTISGSHYQHIFHLNEVLAAICRVGPPIPDPLMELVIEEASKDQLYGPTSKFCSAHIRKILRSIKIPEYLANTLPDIDEETGINYGGYRSIPRAQNQYNSVPMKDLTRFSERWRWIISKINDEILIPVPHHLIIQYVRDIFIQLKVAFFKVSNRRHMIHYGYMIIKIFEHLEHKFNIKLVRVFSQWIPVPSPQTCRQLDKIMQQMCNFTGLYFKQSEVISVKYSFKDGDKIIVNYFCPSKVQRVRSYQSTCKFHQSASKFLINSFFASK